MNSTYGTCHPVKLYRALAIVPHLEEGGIPLLCSAALDSAGRDSFSHHRLENEEYIVSATSKNFSNASKGIAVTHVFVIIMRHVHL